MYLCHIFDFDSCRENIYLWIGNSFVWKISAYICQKNLGFFYGACKLLRLDYWWNSYFLFNTILLPSKQRNAIKISKIDRSSKTFNCPNRGDFVTSKSQRLKPIFKGLHNFLFSSLCIIFQNLTLTGTSFMSLSSLSQFVRILLTLFLWKLCRTVIELQTSVKLRYF